MRPKAGHPVLLLSALLALAAAFAMAEIQIEGADGWAARLPTWRMEGEIWNDLFWGGRAVTGYHVWVFLFMAMAFHFAMVLTGRWSVRLEARALGSLMLFWVMEDAFWFAFNPAYGLGRLRPDTAPWHPHWLGGVPVDYVVFGFAGLLSILWSFRPVWIGRLAGREAR